MKRHKNKKKKAEQYKMKTSNRSSRAMENENKSHQSTDGSKTEIQGAHAFKTDKSFSQSQASSLDELDGSHPSGHVSKISSFDSVICDSYDGTQVYVEHAKAQNKHRSEMPEPHDKSKIGVYSDLHNFVGTCTKHPWHKQFIPISALAIDHLLEKFQVQEWVDLIKLKATATVKLLVSHVSDKRPIRPQLDRGSLARYSSGTVFPFQMKHDEDCGCDMGEAGHRVSGIFKVLTSAQTVFDDSEARSTVVQFFFDSPDDQGIVEGWGEKVSLFEEDNQRAVIDCRTHDLSLWQRLEAASERREQLIREELEPRASSEAMVVLISHPHGMSKHVSLGKLSMLNRKNNEKTTSDGIKLVDCTITHTAPTCVGCAGASVNVFGAGAAVAAFAPHGVFEESQVAHSGLGWTQVIHT